MSKWKRVAIISAVALLAVWLLARSSNAKSRYAGKFNEERTVRCHRYGCYYDTYDKPAIEPSVTGTGRLRSGSKDVCLKNGYLC